MLKKLLFHAEETSVRSATDDSPLGNERLSVAEETATGVWARIYYMQN